MKPSLVSKLKPIGAVIVSYTGSMNYTYLGRHKIPITYITTTKRVAPDHPASVGPLHTPMVFHLDIPSDSLLHVRIYSRQIPVIKRHIRGRIAPDLIGYDVATADTLFKNIGDSGAIGAFASSSPDYDKYAVPPIDVTIPPSVEKSVLQITFYSMPLNKMMIEVFAPQNMALTPGQVSGNAVFNNTYPGWLTSVASNLPAADIDGACADIKLDGSDNPGIAAFAIVTATTWYSLLQDNMTLDVIRTPSSACALGRNRVDSGDEADVIEGCAAFGGLCHFDPSYAAVSI